MPEHYRTNDLDLEGQPVLWLMPSGDELAGTARITPTGKITAVIKKTGGGEMELRGNRLPSLWRPARPAHWPVELPEPVTTISPPEAPELCSSKQTVEDLPSNDQWPHPGVRLGGASETPRNIWETEARILRCIRTHRVMMYDPPQQNTAWPRAALNRIRENEIVLKSGGRIKAFNDNDYEEYHVDKSDLRALVERWRPTPRDVSDWDRKPNPLDWIPLHTGELFRLRAASPPYEWSMISEVLKTDEQSLIETYQKALRDALRRARG